MFFLQCVFTFDNISKDYSPVYSFFESNRSFDAFPKTSLNFKCIINLFFIQFCFEVSIFLIAFLFKVICAMLSLNVNLVILEIY